MIRFRLLVVASSLVLMVIPGLTALELIWSGVSPGEISGAGAAVRLVVSSSTPEALLALSTEDRHTRLYRVNGEMALEVRTGFRHVTAVLQERAGTLLVAGDRGGVARIDPDSGGVQRLAALQGDLGGVWPDAAGNLFVLKGNREILHLSAAGRILWQRSLPSPVRAAVWAFGALYLATGDGGLFRFDSSGNGEVIHRSTAVTQMTAVPRRFPRSDGEMVELLTVDQDQFLHLLQVDLRRGSVQVRRVWSREVPGETRLLGSDQQGYHWIAEMVGSTPRAIQILDSTGELKGRFISPGVALTTVVLNQSGGNAYAVDEDGRLLVIDAAARVEQTIRLEEPPLALVMNAATGHLLLRFPDWRYTVYRESQPATPEIDPVWYEPPRPAGFTGALGALATTVFSGTSAQERVVLLDVLTNRLDEGALFGQVDEFRNILVYLMTEAYSAPVTVRGTPVNDFPGIRLQAIGLLEQLLDVPTRQALTQVVRHEPQELVVAQALQALGAFPRDQFGALEAGMARFRSASRDATRITLATGLVALIEELAVSPQTVAAATELSGASISRDLRRRAVAAIRR